MSSDASQYQSMALYRGERTIDGVVVTYDEISLVEVLGISKSSREDFEWGYEGDAPMRLAHALLLHRTGSPEVASALSPLLMKQLVAKFENEWEIQQSQLDQVIEGFQRSMLTSN